MFNYFFNEKIFEKKITKRRDKEKKAEMKMGGSILKIKTAVKIKSSSGIV